jgi:hypothetical protein
MSKNATTEMNAQNITIHGEKKTITAIGKFNSGHTKPVVRKEDGKVFSSITDAAANVGVAASYLSKHLIHPDKITHVKGSHYCYLKDLLDNPDEMLIQLRRTSADKEALITRALNDAEDARKWREHLAQQDKQAEEKAKKQEADRIAAEKRQKEIDKLEAKVKRAERIYNDYDGKTNRALTRLVNLKTELAALKIGKE